MDKTLKVIKAIINALMTMILIFGIIFVTLYVIGIEPFVVETGSMQPTIQTGSLSFINKNITYDKIKENDVIAFRVQTGDLVTHRVIKITEDGLETKGDSNDVSDGISTTSDNYIGKNIFSIPKAGLLVKIIQTPRGKIVLITFIILILIYGFLFGENKKTKH